MTDAAQGRLATLQLKLGGMSCSFCVSAVERGLKRERGIEEVHVSLAHEEALVRFRPDQTSPSRIRDVLHSLGFLVRDPRKVAALDEQIALKQQERADLTSAASIAIALFLAMAAMWLDLWEMREWHVWTAWTMASYVFFWNGRRIIRMAFGAARRGIANQHVLLTMGALGGYIGGVLGAPVPPFGWYGFVGFPAVDFFGVTVFLTTYHLLSGYVGLMVRTRASESVRRLLSLQPDTAWVLRDGLELEVAVEDVRVGDRVRVRPGERVPVDGVVEQGASAVDQSLVTGEPIPADKVAGDEVIGGSINQTGTLLVRAVRVGEDGFLRRVARHVEEAKAMKPGIIVLVDRILVYFVPLVLAIALAAFLFWAFAPILWGAGMEWVTAIYAAVTVLVMGYPCALGMATPLALIRGGGIAAERGILMRSGESFQIIKDITHVVFDKTRTVTEGKPRLVAVDPIAGFKRNEILRLAASAEFASEHPLARAIVDAAQAEGLSLAPARDFAAIAGKGVSAVVGEHAVLVGTPRLFAERAIDVAPARATAEAHEAQARTVVLLAVDGRIAGVLAIADRVKPDAAAAVETLKQRGLTPILVTGDNRLTAEAVARQVGIDQKHARALPGDKVNLIRSLQAAGARVAMVGDGINDAPALMQADVGIAVGAGTDIAIESADVVLVGHRLMAVPEAIAIGALSYRKTVQNLCLAFFFNGVGVPVAASGMLHPAWAMAAMVISVSAVLANSFGGRILRHRADPAVQQANEVQTVRAGAQDHSTVTLSVPGIRCHGCIATIRAGLMMEQGVVTVDGDAHSRIVTVCYDGSATSTRAIITALSRLGFAVK